MNKNLFVTAIIMISILASGCVVHINGYDINVDNSTITVTTHLNKENLGKLIFEDTELSTPPGQSCESCHAEKAGFSDPRTDRGVSPGAVLGRFGLRKSPRIQYDFSPDFHFNETLMRFEGGQFRDGRAPNLTDQVKRPILNRLEMNNPDQATVIEKIKNSPLIATAFKNVYGDSSLENSETAYDNMADALAAYIKSTYLIKYTSKFDYYLDGKVNLDDREKRGLELFKKICASCHPIESGPFAARPLFTDFSYTNIGVPSNIGMLGDTNDLQYYFPFYYPPLVPEFNPEGLNFADPGLGGALEKAGVQGFSSQLGKFKVPSLRNVAKSPPYFHNGALRTLKEVVHFYNTRDILGDCASKEDPSPSINCWPKPEWPNETKFIGNFGLTENDENDIVTFLMILTDDFDLNGNNPQTPISYPTPSPTVTFPIKVKYQPNHTENPIKIPLKNVNIDYPGSTNIRPNIPHKDEK
jgi:cytochrome c peroxidase